MSEPTRQQIKEAFGETIDRWEKIVEDIQYYECSDCPLCSLFPGATCEKDICPVGIYVKRGACDDTPFWKFTEDNTPANALAELNFLRKVYIWWMEEEEKDKKWEGLTGYTRKEKKEEWADVAGELTAKVSERVDGFAVNLYHNDLNVAFIDGDGIYIRTESRAYAIYKVEIKDEAFCILKKS